jgi:hypothetical protein
MVSLVVVPEASLLPLSPQPGAAAVHIRQKKTKALADHGIRYPDPKFFIFTIPFLQKTGPG